MEILPEFLYSEVAMINKTLGHFLNLTPCWKTFICSAAWTTADKKRQRKTDNNKTNEKEKRRDTKTFFLLILKLQMPRFFLQMSN